MSDENTQEVQAPEQAGTEQQTTEAQAPVEAPQPVVEENIEQQPAVDPASGDAAAPVEAPVPAEEPVKTFFDGQEVVEKLDHVTEQGRMCKLADGREVFIPLDVLGE